jgi:hypothetical protein
MVNNTGTDPRDVISPRSNWQLSDVLYESDDWSMAIGSWRNVDGSWKRVLAQRWNGWEGSTKGNPVSRGFPTWFILPTETFELYIESEFVPANKRAFVRDFLGLSPARDAA